ncbi:hypothetical protein EV586_10755 [Tumebacillus sp. BK434]|nr:hypothetical protein [Tumebacillus sp. BK434]TCP52812.1 hypothetical protein EV586_10755 [Tumebacillus sp. BK434]
MAVKVMRTLRIVSTIAGVVAGVMELRNMYFRRKRMWHVLRRLIRQVG